MNQKKQRVGEIIVFISLYIILLLKHFRMGIISDDSVLIATVGNNLSFTEVIKQMITYYYEVGKPFTDGVAIAMYQIPFVIWQIIDPLIWVGTVYLLFCFFKKKDVETLILISILILMIPMYYLSSAGYIITITNYIYPFLALLVVLGPIIKLMSWAKVRLYEYVISVLAIPFACNQDQYAAVAVGFLFFVTIYLGISRNNRLLRISICYLIICLTVYVLLFLSPGHLMRMKSDVEMMYWLPQYANWSIWKKLYEGFSTTIANIIFCKNSIYIALAVTIAFIGLKSKYIYKKIISICPLLIQIIIWAVGSDKFIVYYDYSCGLPDIDINGGLLSYVGIVLSIFSYVFIILSIIVLVEEKQEKVLIIGLLFLAHMSRQMMCLSATIYASSFRTFIPMLFLIACAVLVLAITHLEKEKYMVLGLMSALMIMGV